MSPRGDNLSPAGNIDKRGTAAPSRATTASQREKAESQRDHDGPLGDFDFVRVLEKA